jgi:DNA-binding NarL/FixJ family response regulator
VLAPPRKVEPVPTRRGRPRGPSSAPRRPGRAERAELEVLELVREGAGNREIAPALSIGEATVKADLLRIYAKLGVNDRTAAVVTALERGLLVL